MLLIRITLNKLKYKVLWHFTNVECPSRLLPADKLGNLRVITNWKTSRHWLPLFLALRNIILYELLSITPSRQSWIDFSLRIQSKNQSENRVSCLVRVDALIDSSLDFSSNIKTVYKCIIVPSWGGFSQIYRWDCQLELAYLLLLSCDLSQFSKVMNLGSLLMLAVTNSSNRAEL